jgi:RHS repeat-associated protein
MAQLLQKLTDTATGNTTSYSYDGMNRLIEAASTGSATSDYKYTLDPAGNRTQSVTNGTSSAIDTFNAADQLTNRGGAEFGGYDANGNATSDGTGQAYGYSPTNQTTAITPAGGSTTAATYLDSDQTDRTTFGTTTSINGLLGDDQDTTGSNTTYYTRDPSGQLINQRTPTGTYYYLYDLRGSVVGLTASSGNKVDSYSYDPDGNITSAATAAPVANPWKFNAGYLDAATGLYHFGSRYYDPRTARFTQPDPTGQESNIYLYAAADPIDNSDPTGTKSHQAFWGLVDWVSATRDYARVGGAIGGLAGCAGGAIAFGATLGPEAAPVGCFAGGIEGSQYGAVIYGAAGFMYYGVTGNDPYQM